MVQRGILKGNLKKYIKRNENKNTTKWTLRDIAKAMLKGKFIALN